MGWTNTTDRATGYVPGATDWNIIQDDLTFLYGDTTWTTPASFTNSWTNSANVGYILMGRVVYLRGLLGAGTLNTSAFTLGAGYRPSASMAFLTSGGAGVTANLITIATAGTVTITTSANTHLDGISFPIV